jgi:hypothetical protein
MENRISGVAAWALLLLLIFGANKPALLVAAVIPIGLLFGCNWPLYRLFHRQRGLFFSVGAIGLHWFHYLYTAATFFLVALESSLRSFSSSARNLRPESAPPRPVIVRD